MLAEELSIKRAQGAQGIQAQGNALGTGLEERGRLKACGIGTNRLANLMQQTFSLQYVCP
jgi:hypothetical protein